MDFRFAVTGVLCQVTGLLAWAKVKQHNILHKD